jgi:pimeloyl-ACP methyl ester carboxylesterase
MAVSSAITWFGTPHNLTPEYDPGELAATMPQITHEHLVLRGEMDGWMPLADLERMAAEMPNCRLVTVPGIGHSMTLEQPALYAGYFGGFLGSVPV